jgi:hypothetical protein
LLVFRNDSIEEVITVKSYTSDGRMLLGVEYDDQPMLHDTVDGMRVISADRRAEDEYALFMLEPSGSVGCYVLDETYIVGRVFGFDTLIEAVQAWNDGEI